MASKWSSPLKILGAVVFGTVLFAVVADRANASSAEDILKKLTELQDAIKNFDAKSEIADTFSELRKLLLEKKLIDDTEERKIHVINSWFGDLRSRWREGRLCVSTNAVRRLCQEQPKCPVAVTEALCGFDPAPFAEERYKALAVKFACIQGGKQDWDELARHPGIDPHTKKIWKSHDTYTVILRGSAMEVRCPYPVSADGK